MKEYLNISRASDIENKKERAVYRMFEMMPGLLSFGVLILSILLSWLRPLWVAVFIMVFVIYWLFRTIYFAFHLWSGYKKMKKNEKTEWMSKIDKDIYHFIVIPMYTEPIEIVRDCFDSIIRSDYPKKKMIVVLALEERARKEVEETARIIEKEYGSKFLEFMITWHPADIPGEIAGKGSNETWAAKRAKEEIIDNLSIPYENIIFSSFDVDTCIFEKYFSCVAYNYINCEKPTRTSFQPVPLYINNIWQAPVISRVFAFSATFWHTMNQERPEKLVSFSSHSMSLKALLEVGYKQTNVVSDDSRIFWQCFLKFDGDYRVKPLYYPISMDANVAKSFWRTLVNIYKQQRRWAYGVGDIPYFLFGFLKNKKIPFMKKLSLTVELVEGHFSWATASIMIFLLGWLPLILGGPEFSQTLISYNLPKIISRMMTLSMIGLVSSAYLSFIILPPRPPDYGKFKYLVFGLGWVLFPVMMIFFTSIPALEAQGRWLFGKYLGFWVTEKVRK